jgi:hypothetical protein
MTYFLFTVILVVTWAKPLNHPEDIGDVSSETSEQISSYMLPNNLKDHNFKNTWKPKNLIIFVWYFP